MLLLAVGCGGGGSSNPTGGGTGGGSGTGGGGGGTGGSSGNPIQIQLVEPSRAMAGADPSLINLAGTNFTPSSEVLFDGTLVPTSYKIPQLQFQVPNSAWGVAESHTVQVSDPANGKSNVATYLVYTPQAGPTPFVGQLSQYMSESPIANSLVPDLNGDGRADLILLTFASLSSPGVPVVRYGQTNGLFSASTPLGTFILQFSPIMVIAGDFNGDGYADLIFFGGPLNSDNSYYQVLLNDGTGKFSSAGSGALPAAQGVVPTAVGDFNGDGKLDFAYGAATDGQAFSLFFGNGDGTFSAPTAIGTSGGSLYEATASDLNGDGFTDLVYTYIFTEGVLQSRMLLSNASGAFTDSPLVGLPGSCLGFVVGDFNGDHIPDIFAIDANTNLGTAYLGTGNGTFTGTGNPILASDGYYNQTPLVAGDFDHDGNLDVATRTILSGPDEILFLWGDGKGDFTSQSIVSDHSATLQVGDVNGDGIADIFAAGAADSAYASTVLGRSNRSFPSARVLLPNNWGDLSAGDVLGDGFNDLLVSGGNIGTGPIPGTLYHYQPNGTFASEGSAPGYETFLVDLNGDGIADMVGTSGSNVLIWKGDGSGVFQEPINQIPIPNGFLPIYFRDMDGDGNFDIVLPGAILYGKGNFQFASVPIQFFENFVVGDFDGDGTPDIATSSGTMFGLGNRTFTAPMGATPLPDQAGYPQVAADINGDGIDDLVLGVSDVEIYLSTGRSGFEFDQSLLISGDAVYLGSLSIADFNGDGLLDIAAGNDGSGEDIVLFTNDGTGKYQVTSYAIGVESVFSIASDFNDDGKPDLALRGFYLDFVPPTVTLLTHQ